MIELVEGFRLLFELIVFRLHNHAKFVQKIGVINFLLLPPLDDGVDLIEIGEVIDLAVDNK